MPELDTDDLIMGSRLFPWKAVLMCLDSLRFSRYARNPHTQTVCKVLLFTLSCGFVDVNLVPRATLIPHSTAIVLVAGLGMEYHSHRWIYQEGMFVDGPSRTTSSSSYSLREIIPEREPIPAIDFLDSELVEGPVIPSIGLGASIKEDPSEPQSDLEMILEPEEVAPANVGDMGTFVAGSSLIAASLSPILPVEVREHDSCGYCLWREQQVEAAS
ncbi:hypothetical protein M9H77_16156 [Catharanthus roseus]|uniref:Uncharacterized protein n=1 Tax=Catharanthus roseus TaxID=4058 RepID=A0ACC0B104_CATRO|nr:hypothetical protein M9H77_16156 [Catharanthus roseus]